MSKVKVLYDFTAESTNEITTYTGEELTVLDPNSYEGWLKIRNSRGQEGIVPTAYVEFIEEDQDIPPPPSHYPASTTASLWESTNFSETNSYMNSPPSYSQPAYNTANQVKSWDNTASTYNTSNTYSNNNSRSANHESDSDDFDDDDVKTPSSSYNSQPRNPTGAYNSSTLTTASSMNPITKHKTKNSYGLDVFLLFGEVKPVAESDRYSTIVLMDHRQSVWKRRSPAYSISILGYSNDRKYHGVKKFISYEIQTEKFPQRVKRRYNQFDWLHKRLEEKYPNICIPPLPDKAAIGNFEDDFIMKRKSQLELWLNRLSSHPVISESEVFIHFLQCDDTSAKWKAGKRKAEKDEYRGAQWFCTLTVPGESSDTTTAIKERVDKFSKASLSLDYCVRNVGNALDKINSLHVSTYKKELTNFGKRLEEFGSALSAEPLDAQNNSALSRAIVTTGNIYNQIGNSYAEQGKEDVGPMLDRLSMYSGIIQQMPDIVKFEKNAIQTYEEFQQRPEKLQGRALSEVAPRREIISHVTFAEINQFNKDKVDDLTLYMRSFLAKQIKFYDEIGECLKRAQAGFEQIPVSNAKTISPTSNGFNKSLKR